MTVTADPAVQLRLLGLQAADTALAQLAHRRRTLPELAVLADCAARMSTVEGQTYDVQSRLDDVADDQRRMENEIDAVRARKARDEARLAGGGLPGKELEGLQHEVTTLIRRQNTLEDDLLEVMEKREELDAEQAGVAARRAQIEAQRDAATAARTAAFSEIDAAITARTDDRAAILTELPPDLVALYEKARAHSGGVGAAVLRLRRCEGCRIELSGAELSAARSAAPHTVLRCENCRRILVRTADSGL